VEDVASAFVALLESDVAGPVNIASGLPLTLKEVICKIGERLGRPELIRFEDIPLPEGEPLKLVADVQRLRKEVGWIPEFDIDKGLDKTIKWWKENLKGR
jgi:nucleoside-diphosphate-sugar epimerase